MARERLAALALLLGGGAICFIGARSLVAPQAMVQPFSIVLRGPAALSEIRASFGGMHLGVGGFLLAAAFLARLRRPALLLLILYMTGLATGRLASLALDGAPSPLIWRLLVAELLLAALSTGALAAQRPWKQGDA